MTSYFAPFRAASAEPLALDMQSLFLSGHILPFGVKLSVTHVFRSSEESPVEAVYCFPLPRDASLVGFEIRGEGFSVSSRLEPAVDAQKHYEQALEAGSLAALTQENLDGLVNLTIGNLRPGETVALRLDLIAGLSLRDNGFRFRFPFTVAPCYHSQMRAGLEAPGVGSIELPEAVSGGVFLPPFHRDPAQLHRIGFELRVESAAEIDEIASPSHTLRLQLNDAGGIGVKLAADRDFPNRDLILDVTRKLADAKAWCGNGTGGRKHFAVIAPSTIFGQKAKTPRRIVFLLDRSGSMQGPPLAQARRAIEDCLAKLSPEDQFGIVAFDDHVEKFRETLAAAISENLDAASEFLSNIEARGGTELASSIEAAAGLLGRSTGEIFVVTDGQVSETVEILRRARRSEIRLFCLGIGSASQDRFLELLARQTGGVCRFVTPSERADTAASELFAALGGAVASGVRIANSNVQPPASGTVFFGTPFFAYGDIDASAAALDIESAPASLHVPLEPLPDDLDALLEKLQGARLIADLEATYDRSDPDTRRRLLALSRQYELASSEMSLVAVVERPDDQPGNVPKTKIIPVGMPQDTEFSSYFGETMSIYARPIAMLSVEAAHVRWHSGSFAKRPTYSETSRQSLSRSRSHYRLAKVDDLLTDLRKTVRTLDSNRSLRAEEVNELLQMLVQREGEATNNAQKTALAALIDFLSNEVIDSLDSGRFDSKKWSVIRRQLENAWPELVEARRWS